MRYVLDSIQITKHALHRFRERFRPDQNLSDAYCELLDILKEADCLGSNSRDAEVWINLKENLQARIVEKGNTTIVLTVFPVRRFIGGDIGSQECR